MANAKIQVNTGVAIEVIASNTIPIPSPDMTPVSGETTATTADKLVDSGKDFTANGVQVGDIVYNTTDKTVATVTAIDSATTLSLSANIMAASELYTIYLTGTDRPKSAEGCILYVGSNDLNATVANIKVKTIHGDDVTFSTFPVGNYLPVQVVQLYATGTTDISDNNCIAIW